MRKRPLHLILSALAYGSFVAVVAWAVAFLSGTLVPLTVDGPVRATAGVAVATDVALLLLFALQHTVMARRPVKRALERRLPRQLERTAFVLATVACLALLFGLWQPVGGWVWHVDGPWALVLWAGFVAGWVLTVVSTFLVDHLEFVGLRQTGWAAHVGRPRPAALRLEWPVRDRPPPDDGRAPGRLLVHPADERRAPPLRRRRERLHRGGHPLRGA